MNIKGFGLSAPRAKGMMQRILADIERRAPLPQLNLSFRDHAFNWPDAGKLWPVAALTCAVTGTNEAFHAAVIDMDPNDPELTVLLTHTLGEKVGFKTTYKAVPQAAVFIAFDFLQFFYERVPVLEETDEDGLATANPVFRKNLEVENILKAVYTELPETYTWQQNIEARKPDNAPIVEWK